MSNWMLGAILGMAAVGKIVLLISRRQNRSYYDEKGRYHKAGENGSH